MTLARKTNSKGTTSKHKHRPFLSTPVITYMLAIPSHSVH